MLDLSERSQPIDLVTLKEELERAGDLEEVGGPAYIASLVDGVPRSTNVEYYAQIVKEKATLRNLIFSANKILGSAYEADQEADLILDEAESAIFAVAEDRIKAGLRVDERRWSARASRRSRSCSSTRPSSPACRPASTTSIARRAACRPATW